MQPVDSDRRTSTFIFADLAGFTALTEAHGDEQAADLAAEFCDTVRQLLAEYGAEEVKTIGDAIMLRCEEARAAVDLGLRIVDEVGLRPHFPIVRVGMHTGSAVGRGGDWFGAAVNLAARVSGSAGGDEVLLTQATRDAAGQLEAIQLRRRGKQRFKNIKDPIVIYRAVREGQERKGLPIDPVCRMAVDPGKGAGTLTYEGREYHFCSMECVQAFAATPGDYAGSN